jgi:hypothetical protein
MMPRTIIGEASHPEQHHAERMPGFFSLAALNLAHGVNGLEFIRAKAIGGNQSKMIKSPVVVLIRG